MQIELIEDPGLVARLGQSATFGHRSEGLHVSEIYGRLMARLEPKKYGKPIDADARARMEVGILFENILEQGLREKYTTQRVGEVYSDPVWSPVRNDYVRIAMSPDGVNPNRVRGEEYKATFKKYPNEFSKDCPSRGSLVDAQGAPLMQFFVWFVQMRAYAKWLEMLDWTLYVVFLYGDYLKPILPIFQPYDISFSQDEVDDNWEMLIRVALDEGLL